LKDRRLKEGKRPNASKAETAELEISELRDLQKTRFSETWKKSGTLRKAAVSKGAQKRAERRIRSGSS